MTPAASQALVANQAWHALMSLVCHLIAPCSAVVPCPLPLSLLFPLPLRDHTVLCSSALAMSVSMSAAMAEALTLVRLSTARHGQL